MQRDALAPGRVLGPHVQSSNQTTNAVLASITACLHVQRAPQVLARHTGLIDGAAA